MFTKSNIKIMCIVAWLHRELIYAELSTKAGEGEVIIEDVKFIRLSGALILEHWHKKGWTYKNISALQVRIRKIKDFYNSVDKSIQKTIREKKETVDLNNNWIPMYLTLAIAKKFKNKNIEIFPEGVDLLKMIEIFSKTDKVDKRTKLAYWSLAGNILEDMRNVK